MFAYVPGPGTIVRGIRQLEPGHLLVWERGRPVRESAYLTTRVQPWDAFNGLRRDPRRLDPWRGTLYCDRSPRWDRWGWLVALAALLGAEWVLRRRFGYI